MTIWKKQKPDKKAAGNSPRFAGSCRFRLPKTSGYSAVRFVKYLGNKVATALSFVVPMRRRSSSTKGSTCSSSGRSKPFVTPVIDSQRTEAIADCIEFINSSSSSLQRSNSVPENLR